ncbi:hypothetical protein PHISCL_06680, partial [Aspergillus sclerotialis]
MDSNGNHSTSRSLSASIPIAQISPVLDRLEQHSIRAVVTLVWPYSSATKTLSLLLSEVDFRLRRAKGQVKVIFYGTVAEKVAKSKVGIGDEVALSLSGSRLVNNETTGNCVAWDVHFDDRVLLEVYRSSTYLSTVNIELPEKPSTTDETPIPPSTPQNVGAGLGGTGLAGGLGAWESPAFLQRSRTSFGGLVDTPLDPFVEEDGFVPGKGRKRPRFSMRSSDWRVIDEPESPQEKIGAVDWMEMFEDEISEPEVEDKNVAGDVEAAEPPATGIYVEGAEELPNFTESQEIPTFHPVSEPREVPPEPEPEQMVGPSVQLVEPDAEQHHEPAHHETGTKEHLNPSIHLPTDTPRLHPIPSPGLPVPSPLVTTNNSNGYFSSFTTSTTQTPTGPLCTTQTQTTITKVEERVDPHVQPETLQAQGGPFGPETSEERIHLPEHVPGTQGFSIDARISEPTTVDKNAELQYAPNTQRIEGLGIAPEHNEEISQSETIAERALQAQGSTAEEIVEYSEAGSVADDREESDVDQVYSEKDGTRQDEDEWSEGQESEENIDEQEQNLDHQEFHSKPSHDGSQVEIINLDSDEGEETMERYRTRDASIEEDDQYSSMEDDIDEADGHYAEVGSGEDEMEDEKEDEVSDEAEEDDEVGDQGDEVPADYEATPADFKEDEPQAEEGVETAVDKDEAMSTNSEGEESEDEDLYDGEVEDDYEAENERRTGYDDYVDSDLESEEVSEEGGGGEEEEEEEEEYQQPSPPKNVQPEVIVLDSDSDEENHSTIQPAPAQQHEQDIHVAQETEPHMPPADEYSASSEGSVISEVEDMAASAKDEYVGDEVSKYEQMEEDQLEERPTDKDQVVEERVEEEQAVEQQMGIEEVSDVEVEDKAIVDEQTELSRVGDARAQDDQSGDKPMEGEQ